jgi:cyclopropane-fatty-acyl-phospholipid synthase
VLISDCYFPKEVRGNRDSPAARYIFERALGYCRLVGLSEELGLLEEQGLDVTQVVDLTSSYVATLERWIDGVRRHRQRIEALAPGFAKILQTYMTVAKLTFQRRHAIEYMIVARKPEAAR